MHLSGITIYPVKSLGGIDVDAWDLDDLGLAWDRRWMVVDESGRFLTQRQVPAMARVRPRLDPGGQLTLTHPRLPSFTVPDPAPEAATRPVTVWGDTVPALPLGAEVGAWLSKALGRPCHLVRLPEGTARAVDPNYAPDARTAFTDGFPLLLIGEGSLADLNARLQQPVPMRRFRPNLVVAGAEPFAEDQWRRIRIGGITLRVVKPCSRCIVTTVDPDRGEVVGQEPLRTLATYRLRNNKIYFGQNLVHEGPGRLRVGDAVTILE